MSSKHAASQLYSNILENVGMNVSDLKKQARTPKQLERYCKGVANHRRIEILMLVANQQGITLDQITQALDCNFKTISEHTRRLVGAGLVEKKYQGKFVAHSLSPKGKLFYNFLKSFQHS